MAACDHRVSRRALLGAAWPIAMGLAPSPRRRGSSRTPEAKLDSGSSPENEEWNFALARLRRAEARLKALEHDPDEDLFDNANSAFNHALKKLIRTPAPSLRALSTKIDFAVDQEVATLTGGEACLAVLKADARRLSLS